MTFTEPKPNTFNLHRTVTRDAQGRRVVIKEVAEGNTKLLSIVGDRSKLTLTQSDAAQLAALLADYAEKGTLG